MTCWTLKLPTAPSKRTLSILFATLAIVGRVGYFIVTPLWLDFFRSHSNSTAWNQTDNSSFPTVENVTTEGKRITVFFVLISQWSVTTSFYGAILVLILVFWPHLITDVERTYPKKQFFIIGSSSGVSSVLFNFALSGSRTAPYLQAVLANCNIPIQFVVRFLVLRKRPTWIKMACAGAVLLAEFVCLLPTIFPSLENAAARKDDGGAVGVAAVLWPMCFVLSMVPFAISNSVMERSVQQETPDPARPRAGSLNLVYFLFWFNLFTLVTVCALFWTDIIPGFGTSSSITDFGSALGFDVACIFGQRGCHGAVVGLAWSNFLFCIFGTLAFAGLMRYSEGANFAIIVLTLRTPILFLFWTLFEESPFAWHPHAHLATWLSIGAIAIMLPAIIVYDLSPPERTRNGPGPTTYTTEDVTTNEFERRPLLSNSEPSNNRAVDVVPYHETTSRQASSVAVN